MSPFDTVFWFGLFALPALLWLQLQSIDYTLREATAEREALFLSQQLSPEHAFDVRSEAPCVGRVPRTVGAEQTAQGTERAA